MNVGFRGHPGGRHCFQRQKQFSYNCPWDAIENEDSETDVVLFPGATPPSIEEPFESRQVQFNFCVAAHAKGRVVHGRITEAGEAEFIEESDSLSWVVLHADEGGSFIKQSAWNGRDPSRPRSDLNEFPVQQAEQFEDAHIQKVTGHR